ncbi:MAG: D-alanine--D-alanine ligase [Candidatus Harrisonbacteria bacterium]|nr:D-alanine--D-alanine ligase [Candidatus Harrisonbacteria bacterium]
MKKIRIVVLMGGPSAEHEVSLKSGAMVLKNLDPQKYSAMPIVVGKDGKWPVAPEMLKRDYDLAFIAMHGEYGEDGMVQALLESLGVPFTGSDAKASRLGMDKIAAARAFKKAGLNTPPTVNLGRIKKFPVVIKPADRGSSVGVSVVKNHAELQRATAEAKKYSPNVIAQQFISGREFTCGVLEVSPSTSHAYRQAGSGHNAIALPPTEIVVKRGVFFDFDAKYTPNASEEITPPRNLPAAKIKALQQAALTAHRAIGARGISRTDMIMNAKEKIYVLEINTIPGMTENSLVPKEAAVAGISRAKLLDFIIAAAL